jgi:5-methyltetrahydrofolate--homocysteine methyltransferase
MLIVGERINASRKAVAQAISEENREFIRNEAKTQTQAGAHYLDVNAGTFIGREAERLKWVVEAVQEASDLPLCVDSPDPAVIKAILPLLSKTPLINSVTLEQFRLEIVLPLAVEYRAKLIALCQSQDASAHSAEEKLGMAGQLVEKATNAGIPIHDLYIDPLVYPLGTDQGSAIASLNAIEMIMSRFPGVHTICGLTNVSHGLPLRPLINRTFLAAALLRGLDSVIMDPTDKLLYGTLKAALVVANKDDFCVGYIKAFREGKLA